LYNSGIGGTCGGRLVDRGVVLPYNIDLSTPTPAINEIVTFKDPSNPKKKNN
jgi:hypothetical protein